MLDLGDIPSVADLLTLEGKKVLVRVDFNTPLVDSRLRDTLRIDAALPTLRLLLSRGARVILVSHQDDDGSLAAAAEYLNREIPLEFLKQGEAVTFASTSLVLLENLRFSSGEEENSEYFAKELAALADYYVNEAFSASHRSHASIVGLPRLLPSYAGLRFLEEVRELSQLFDPEHPFLFILGGAKVKTKEPLLIKFLELADSLFVGGVLANDFLKSKGYPVGRSVLSNTEVDLVLANHPRAILPEDVLVVSEKGEAREAVVADVGSEERIVDIGSRTEALLIKKIKEAGTILWNGPLGLYEEGYIKGSKRVAEEMASSGARTVIGGGDTLSALEEEVCKKISFVSTGGGAMLQFLSEETLPGIEALRNPKDV